MMFLVALLSIARAAPDDCNAGFGVPEIMVMLDQAESAYVALDELRFDAQMEAAARALPCVDDTFSPAEAARYHRMVGLRRFVRLDREGAALAFAAARAADPFGAFPSAILPPGHAARLIADTAEPDEHTKRARPPRGATLWFDGVPAHRRPTGYPTLMQLQLDDVVQTTRYLAPGEPLPVEARRACHRP